MHVTWQNTEPQTVTEERKSTSSIVMTRKDTIIVAVLINVALLAFLFATATKKDAMSVDSILRQEVPQLTQHSVQCSTIQKEVDEDKDVFPVDEIDQILEKYLSQQRETNQKKELEIVEKKSFAKPEQKSGMLEVIVVDGDVLSKIAKKYSVTTAEIMKINNLESQRLSIGQRLSIPAQVATQQEPVKKESPKNTAPQTVSKVSKIVAPTYYIVKKGDNPWSIAKKFNIKLEKLLDLNKLTPEQARNLQVGQQIRIR